MLKQVTLLMASMLMTCGLVAPTASAAAATHNISAEVVSVEAAAAWTMPDFTGKRVGIPDATTMCGTLETRAHSAVLLNSLRTVTLYSTTGCHTATIVTVLHAGHAADSGTMAGSPTALGTLGAIAYTVT